MHGLSGELAVNVGMCENSLSPLVTILKRHVKTTVWFSLSHTSIASVSMEGRIGANQGKRKLRTGSSKSLYVQGCVRGYSARPG